MSRDYDDIADRNISEIKDLVEEEDLDLRRLLEAEKANKDRKTLKKWLNKRISTKDEEPAMAGQSNDGTFTFSVTTKQIALATFLIGFFLGGFFMSTLGQATSSTGAVAGDNADQAQNNNGGSPSESQVVALENTELNYPDVETGIAEGTYQENGTSIPLDGEPYLGSPDAPVTLVTFEDFECPFCKQFEEGAMPQIMENFVKSGQVRVVWKDLPLPARIHPWAQEAAIAAECALQQSSEAFWIFKQGFFQNQDQISQSNIGASVKNWADQLGLDTGEFNSCYDDQSTAQEVNQDKQEAGSVGATGTPTAFINGQKIVGAQPYSRFESAITSALES